MLRADYDVTVRTNFNQPSLKEFARQNFTEFINATVNLMSAAESIPDFAKKIPLDSLLEELAFSYNIDLDNIGEVTDKDKEQLMQMIKNL